MHKLVIRHGEKEPGNNPLITGEAVRKAWLLGTELRRAGVDTSSIATSTLLRTRHTAIALQGMAGILGQRTNPAYSALDEVHCDIPDSELYAMLSEGQVPQVALDAAQKVVNNPPAQTVIVTHELMSTGLTAIAENYHNKTLNPSCLEARWLEFNCIDPAL